MEKYKNNDEYQNNGGKPRTEVSQHSEWRLRKYIGRGGFGTSPLLPCKAGLSHELPLFQEPGPPRLYFRDGQLSPAMPLNVSLHLSREAHLLLQQGEDYSFLEKAVTL